MYIENVFSATFLIYIENVFSAMFLMYKKSCDPLSGADDNDGWRVVREVFRAESDGDAAVNDGDRSNERYLTYHGGTSGA